jgi:ribonuclease J
VKESGEFSRVHAVHPWRVFPEDIAPRARELVLLFRPSMITELERAGALEGALAIWSLWRGYLERPTELRMRRALAMRRVPLEVHHVSGHAYVPDLRRLLEAVSTERLIPIYTTSPSLYATLFSRVSIHAGRMVRGVNNG